MALKMARIELLPAELQLQIFSYLQRPDLKAARAVSRTLRDHATPALFRSVIACARYQAMGAFQKVSLHSTYPTYVKEIIFDGSVYQARLAQDEHAYHDAQNKIEELQVGSYWGKRSRWKRYQELYLEQEDMKTSGVLLQTIARALERMPNISSIVYSPHPHLIPAEAKDVSDLLPRGGGLFVVPGFPRRSISHRYVSSDHAFRQLIGAIHQSKYTGVREFTVETYRVKNPGTEFSLCFFDFPEAVDLQAGRHFFQHLIKLELNMALESHNDDMTNSHRHRRLKQLSNLANLLVTAIDLHHLAFHLPHWSCSKRLMYGHILSDEQSVFHHVGLRTTWQNLQSLSLEGIYADERDFTDLIKRHKTTLRSLTFRKCSLCSGLWAGVVDEVVFYSIVVSFVLDSVNETDTLGEHTINHNTKDNTKWRYEGHLLVSDDGERKFVDTDSEKKSVHSRLAAVNPEYL